MAIPKDSSELGFSKEVEHVIGKGHCYRFPYKIYGYGKFRHQFVRFYNLYAFIKLSHFAKKNNIDLIYTNTCLNCIGILVSRYLKLMHIWHFHEPVDSSFGWSSSYKNWFSSLLSYNKNEVIFISQKQRTGWELELGHKIEGIIIYNPTKIIRDKEIRNPKETIFGFIGGFTKRKNIDAVIRAFEIVFAKHPEVKLLLCGAKNHKEIEDYTSTNIHVEKQTTDVESFYNSIDVLILPSFMETMPLVVIEAMQAGVCVIQTTQSGMKELFDDNKDTFFVDPNDIEGIVDKMNYLLSHENRVKMSHSCKEHLNKLKLNQDFQFKIANLIKGI